MAGVHQNFHPFKCDYCDSNFGKKWSLRKHRQKVHLNKMPYKCNLCDRAFELETSFEKHLNDEHQVE